MRLYPEGTVFEDGRTNMSTEDAYWRAKARNSSFQAAGINYGAIATQLATSLDPAVIVGGLKDMWDGFSDTTMTTDQRTRLTEQFEGWHENYKYTDLDGNAWDPLLFSDGQCDYSDVFAIFWSIIVGSILGVAGVKFSPAIGKALRTALGIRSNLKLAEFRDEVLENQDEILDRISAQLTSLEDTSIPELLERLRLAVVTGNSRGVSTSAGLRI